MVVKSFQDSKFNCPKSKLKPKRIKAKKYNETKEYRIMYMYNA